MAMTTTTRSFIGKGKIYAGLKTGGVVAPIGNVSALSLAISEETKDLLDYTSAGGGKKDSLSRISGIVGTMSARDFSPNNLALVLRGATADVTTEPVSNEDHTAYSGGFISTTYLPDTSGATPFTCAISVSDSWTAEHAYSVGNTILESSLVFQCTTAGTSTITGSKPTFAGTSVGSTVNDGLTLVWTCRGAVTMTDSGSTPDFTAGKAGVQISADVARFALGLPVHVSYTKANSTTVQALTSSGSEFILEFDGLNEIDSGNPFYVKLHRVKFGVTSGLPMIADDFGTLEIKFDVLQDTTISGTNISQYLKIAQISD